MNIFSVLFKQKTVCCTMKNFLLHEFKILLKCSTKAGMFYQEIENLSSYV